MRRKYNFPPHIQAMLLKSLAAFAGGPSDRPPIFLDARTYLAKPAAAEPNWIIEGFLPESYLVVLGGDSKSGKSCLVTALAVAVASGEPFLDMQTKQAPVLWCALEESETERALILRSYEDIPQGLYVTHEKIQIDSSNWIGTLREWIRKTSAKVLVIDPLYCASTMDSLSDGMSARNALSKLKELCRTEKVSAVVVHHFNKAVGVGLSRERFADSNQILAAASMDIRMATSKNERGTREIRLVCNGRGEFANRTILVQSSGVTDFRALAGSESESSSSALRKQSILEALENSPHGATSEELASSTGIATGTLRNLISGLKQEGAIEKIGARNKADLYALSPTGPQLQSA